MRTARSVVGILIFGLLAIAPAFGQTATWTIDPDHSTAQFTVRHMAISNVTGTFTKVTGTVELNERDIAQSQVSATIAASASSSQSSPCTRWTPPRVAAEAQHEDERVAER